MGVCGGGCLYLPYCEDEIFSKIHVYYVLDTDKGLFVFLLVSLQHSYSLFNFAINIQGIEDALGLVLASRLQLPQFHPGLSAKANCEKHSHTPARGFYKQWAQLHTTGKSALVHNDNAPCQ